MRAFAAVPIVLLLLGSANAQLYRTHFYGEDAFAAVVPLTDALISKLRAERDFSTCYKRAKKSFEVTKIDPNRDGKAEYLIKGECGNSATSYAFWIVSRDREGYKTIFSAWTMGIDFEKQRQRGYPNINAVGCNANTCFYESFGFNGERYAQKRQWSRPNN